MKLTPKQSLALELLKVKHAFNPVKYEKPSFEDDRLIYRLDTIARQNTRDELTQLINHFVNLRLENENRAKREQSREAYFKENPDAKILAEKQMSSIIRELHILENDTIHLINKQLSAHGLRFWKVTQISPARAVLSINMSKTDEDLRHRLPCEQNRFGYTVDMAFAVDGHSSKPIPEMSVGTMGSFSLYGTDPDHPRSEFYISVGKMLQDKDLLEYMEGMMLDYKKRHGDLVKIYDSLEKFLDNPKNI